jgi:hypothetical protein
MSYTVEQRAALARYYADTHEISIDFAHAIRDAWGSKAPDFKLQRAIFASRVKPYCDAILKPVGLCACANEVVA